MENSIEPAGPLDRDVSRRVICAAVIYPKAIGIMLVGPRHFDSTMRDQYCRFFSRGTALDESESVQGFIDQHGKFMDQFEAMEIALKAGQIDWKRKTHPQDQLFSEDLY